MKFAPVLLLALPAAASWFGSDTDDYTKWNNGQLKDWLNERDIHVPSGWDTTQLRDLVKANWHDGVVWTQDQYSSAQKSFQDIRQSSFDAWDESRLRQFLLEQGVVAPSSKKEELVLLANKHYKQYKNAASTFAATVSTAVFGTPTQNIASTVSAYIAQATTPVVRALDDSTDYIYSTWTDSELRSYLQEKGVLKTDVQIRRDQMLDYMRSSYAAVANPIYNAWSDSYIHEWLVSHGIVKSDYEKRRDDLLALMFDYYYTVNDYVWSTWDELQMKKWLAEHNIVKPDVEISREKLVKLMQDNYRTVASSINSASDTVYSGWKDSDMRQWLIDNGYMKSTAQAKRDELIAMMQSHYSAAASRVQDYTVWPDARLRAYLRNHGWSQATMPTTRDELLHEVRIRWVQTKWESESIFKRIRDAVADTVSSAEEKVSKITSILSGAKHDYGAANAKANDRVKKEL